jgi:flagellar motor switch protein FliM
MALISSQQVIAYNFKSCSLLSSAQTNAFKEIHSQFASQATSDLSSFMGDISLSLERVENHAMAYIKRTHHSPLCCARIDLKPLPGAAILLIEGALAYSIISKLLGGNAETPSQTSSFTNLEIAVSRKFCNVLLKNLKNLWNPLIEMSFVIDEMSDDLGKMADWQSYMPCTASYFKTIVNHISGYIVLLYTAPVLETLQKPLDYYSNKMTSPVLSSSKLSLEHLEIEVSASLGSIQLSFDEFQRLVPGDVLELNHKLENPIDILASKEILMHGRPGLTGKNKGVLLLTPR